MTEERKTSVFVYAPIDEKLRPLIRRHSLKLIQNAALLMFAESSPAMREEYLERVDAVVSTGLLPEMSPKRRGEMFRQEAVRLLSKPRRDREAGSGHQGPMNGKVG